MSVFTSVARKLRSWDERRTLGAISLLDSRLHDLADETAGPNVELANIVRNAWEVGKTISLTNAIYGPADEPGVFFNFAPPYYSFLAGLALTQNCQRVLEIGTHFGGSALALLAGMRRQERPQVVTIDVAERNPAIRSVQEITNIVGDANSEVVIKTVTSVFGNRSIDLLFVDADHSFLPTVMNLGLYAFLLRPRLIVIDDIVLNNSMKSLWSAVLAAYKTNATNCIDIVPEIRSSDCGFGIVAVMPECQRVEPEKLL